MVSFLCATMILVIFKAFKFSFIAFSFLKTLPIKIREHKLPKKTTLKVNAINFLYHSKPNIKTKYKFKKLILN
jgi:hypothetical protein